MILRPLSRALAVSATTAAIVLASVVVAIANPNPTVGLRNVTTGTDVAAPDQQNPIPAPERHPLPGPPTWPLHPQTLTPRAQPVAGSPSSFHWDDAGIGAGGALALVLAGLGVTLVVRRRRLSGPALPA
jgi:hypothetical protein